MNNLNKILMANSYKDLIITKLIYNCIIIIMYKLTPVTAFSEIFTAVWFSSSAVCFITVETTARLSPFWSDSSLVAMTTDVRLLMAMLTVTVVMLVCITIKILDH